MLTEQDVVGRVQRLTVTRLRVWVNEGLIKPAGQVPLGFSEADIARAALICDLEDRLGFEEDEVPVLLNLIDQIHGLRSQLKCLLDALDELPEDARARVKVRVAGSQVTPRR